MSNNKTVQIATEHAVKACKSLEASESEDPLTFYMHSKRMPWREPPGDAFLEMP